VRFADGREERFGQLAAELVPRSEVIVTGSSPPVRAIRQLSASVPITFATINEPRGGKDLLKAWRTLVETPPVDNAGRRGERETSAALKGSDPGDWPGGSSVESNYRHVVGGDDLLSRQGLSPLLLRPGCRRFIHPVRAFSPGA
jgi:hypothetical protein